MIRAMIYIYLLVGNKWLAICSIDAALKHEDIPVAIGSEEKETLKMALDASGW